MTGVLGEKKKEIWTQSQVQGKGHVKMKAETKMRHLSVRDASKSPGAGGEHGTDSLSQLQRKPNLMTPWSWISSLQNCQTMHFYLLSHHVFGILLQ